MPEESQNPYDVSAESAELEALQGEIAQARESIEGDAAKAIAEQITPELEELFFDDKEAFMKEIFGLQNRFLESNFAPKIERANALTQDIGMKQQMGVIDAARQEFVAAHPEVDFNALMQFYSTLDPQTQAGLASGGSPRDFFENLLALQKGGNKGDEPPLPTQLKGVEANASQSAVSGDLPMDRF